MNLGYVDTPEGQIHYRTEGSGKPLLLLHQVGISSDQYAGVIPVLGKSYRVLAMDIPGYGNSYMPKHTYTIAEYAKSAISFLDALKIKKASVAGHLFAAVVAAEIAAANPGRVDKLIFSSFAYHDAELRKERLKALPIMEIKEDGSHLTKWWEKRASMYPYLKAELRQRMLVEYLKSALGTRTEDGHKALFSFDVESRLPLVKAPALLIYGNEDAQYKQVDIVRKLLPQSQVKVIQGAHQQSIWEQPEEYSKAVLEFLGKS